MKSVNRWGLLLGLSCTLSVSAQNSSWPVVHPVAYYTLNNLPQGDGLEMDAMTTVAKGGERNKPDAATPKKAMIAKPQQEVLSYEQVKPLLDKNTCSACHQVDQRMVGPSFTEIAKRRYPDTRMVQLIYNPEPQNWPDYATPMAPMPQVPEAEAMKIAVWINSLRKAD